LVLASDTFAEGRVEDMIAIALVGHIQAVLELVYISAFLDFHFVDVSTCFELADDAEFLAFL
jgi:hypothetical protein